MSTSDSGRNVKRRVVITSAAVAAGGTVLGQAGDAVAAAEPASSRRAVRPPMLKPGDKVRVVSPAGIPSRERVARGVEILKSWGLVVEIAPHVFDEYSYLAGKDSDRIADLNDAFTDKSVKGVFASRGGYGTQRIIDRLNMRAVRKNPKVVVGFSDITSLSGKLWREARLVTFCGPMVNWNDARTGEESIESLRKAVMTTETITLTRDPKETAAPVKVPGKARGVLLGGNLSLVNDAIAADDFTDLRGALFFFEDVGEAPYKLDRMLTHLRRSGKLRGIKGVVIGQITDSVADPGEWGPVEALQDRLGGLGVPVLGGLRLGHGQGQLTVPLGSMAKMDADAGTLTVQPGVRKSS